jgi:glutathione S-transferase
MSEPVLWHLKPSHFNEKARWALDYKGVPHRRVNPPPGAHMLIALALTRRAATLPVLKLDGRAIGDSTRIIAALEERFPEPPLYPGDPVERARALELEELFDATLGPDVRRVGFWEFVQARELVAEHAAELSSPRQAAILKSRSFPAFVRVRYGVARDAAAESLVRIRALMDLIADLLGGDDHLVGDRFTVADLTAAALLAPLIGPPGLPYRRPDAPLPPNMQRISDELRALPAGDWVVRTYERYRGVSAEIGAGPPESAPWSARSSSSRQLDSATR